ncbi:hypothetical protein [Mucilaginibacter sp.]|uniref:hypothetical protein n=1 Tax=Mucilaginibacter sp. TaxID=1882438 RepID=UPI0026124C09|nr:hypothetical protein [Mucilaginibacter sp.]MDB4919863.1 hypothetical protein [Mucilaginibacter sp.]
MLQQCGTTPASFNGLLKIYEDGDAIRMIDILTETLSRDENLHQADKNEIARFIHLLTAITRQHDADKNEIISSYKVV